MRNMEEKKLVSELKKRNLIETIEGCLREHEVRLAGKTGETPMFLIEVTANNSLFSDFFDTYTAEIDSFKRKLAEKIISNRNSPQKYGVLINEELFYSFAFNRKFGDLDRKQKKISFKGVEDALLEMSTSKDLSEFKIYQEEGNSGQDLEPLPDITLDNQEEYDIENDPDFFNDTRMRYSLTGKSRNLFKVGPEVKSEEYDEANMLYEKSSLLDRIKKSYSKNRVELDLPDEDGSPFFYLVNVKYKTSTLDDFMKTYECEIDDFKKKLARRIFGDKKNDNEYGLMISENMQIKYAFNKRFASYDSRKKSVTYKPMEDVLLEKSNQVDFSRRILPKNPFRRIPRSGPTMIRYALVGK
jgi:hypothetical protein